MGLGDVFPAEMPDHQFPPITPLDNNTAERLLSGRLDPDDTPPAYAQVARLLHAAAAPATPDELTGQAAALAAFRAARPVPTRVGSRPTRPRLAGVRGRMVAVALAGTLAAGGLWIADGARFPGELGSPSGGPGAAGSGSGTPGAAVGGSGSDRLLRPAGAATGPGVGGRARVPPSTGDRAIARHGGGVAAGGGGSAHGSRHAKPPKQKPKQKPKPPKPSKAKPGKGGNPRAGGP